MQQVYLDTSLGYDNPNLIYDSVIDIKFHFFIFIMSVPISHNGEIVTKKKMNMSLNKLTHAKV